VLQGLCQILNKQNPPPFMVKYMNKFQKLAAKIIDMVEHDIRRANPEVDAIAIEKKGNTLLYGESYYQLEDAIAEELRKR